MIALDASAARAQDEGTIAGGTPGILLMERAAAAVAREVGRAAPFHGRGRHVVVLAGTGNNGGDGFETARLLARQPFAGEVETLLVGDPSHVGGDARTMLDRLAASGGAIRLVERAEDLEPLSRASLVVDALFGTGLARPLAPEGLHALAIGRIPSGAFVVAVDVPSGLDASRPEPIGPARRADVTVSFGSPKRAHAFPPAAGLCGRLVVADIGLAPPRGDGPECVVARDLEPLFPRRAPAAHKGSQGRLLLAGGSPLLAGAAALAAAAAHRAGAGLVTVLAGPEVRAVVRAVSPESTTGEPASDLSAGDALAIGPGMGTSEEAARLFERALASRLPAVFDADALNLAAGRPERFAERGASTILTPHPGEAGRLLGRDARAVNGAREESARELARRANAVVVLKGFRSVVAAPDGRVAIVLAGNPGMATGGMGDVLTGIAGAFLARGLEAWDAARAAAWLHGAAGDLAAERLGEEGLRARDLVEELPAAFVLVRESRL